MRAKVHKDAGSLALPWYILQRITSSRPTGRVQCDGDGAGADCARVVSGENEGCVAWVAGARVWCGYYRGRGLVLVKSQSTAVGVHAQATVGEAARAAVARRRRNSERQARRL
jgi:hypothetical protein